MFGRATIRLGIGPHSSLHLWSWEICYQCRFAYKLYCITAVTKTFAGAWPRFGDGNCPCRNVEPRLSPVSANRIHERAIITLRCVLTALVPYRAERQLANRIHCLSLNTTQCSYCWISTDSSHFLTRFHRFPTPVVTGSIARSAKHRYLSYS